ncbi:hypothetical protein NMYAN_20233 [Nitrosomonas nitrosa]|uniref:Uncharacterized protein n=1 Tax=Nitrosomonas nitrosa TaxID=52442 RepID=A0A8H8Z175_9PROT|nr:hypothetical protein NMYAN_20233 [Nitrosomonas nitrosa]
MRSFSKLPVRQRTLILRQIDY